jgi:hypothetical protein
MLETPEEIGKEELVAAPTATPTLTPTTAPTYLPSPTPLPAELPEVWLSNAITQLFIAPYYPADLRIIGLGGGNELNLTTDGGRTWTSLSETWETPVLAFQALAMSPDFTADSSPMAAGRATVYDTGATLWRQDVGGLGPFAGLVSH